MKEYGQYLFDFLFLGIIRMIKIYNRIKKYLPYLFIFVFISLYLYQNHVFIQRDNSLPFSDAPGHIVKIATYLQVDKIELDRIVRRDPYPPLAHWNGFVFFKILGPSIDAAQYSLFVFIVIFLLSLYGIGYEYGGHYSGAAVMVLGGSSPHIINYSRYFFVDFPQAAMTAFAFYVLLKTSNYRNLFFSILLGIVFWLGFFTKWSVTFFLLIPMVWFVLPHTIKTLRAFLLSLSFACLVLFFFIRLRFFIFLGQDYRVPEILKIFSLNFLLPGVIFIVAAYFWKIKNEKNWNPKNTESVNGVFNAAITGLISISLPVMWLFWTAKQVFLKIGMDKETLGISAMECEENISVLINSYSYFPIFVILGIILIFVFKERDNFKPGMAGCYNRLILPVNLVLSILWVSYMGPYDTRYILASCIFAAALGGWWVGWLGKARLPVTAVTVVLSILSLTGWLFIPKDSGVLQVIKPDPSPYENQVMNPCCSLKPLTALYPSEVKYDMEPVLRFLREESSMKRMKIFWIFEIGDEPVSGEYAKFLVISKKLNCEVIDIFPDGSNRELLRDDGIVFITCHSWEFADREVEKIRKMDTNRKIEIKRFKFPGDCCVCSVKVEGSK